MAEVNHSARDHALLSASGSKRWLACPPSARFEERAGGKDEGSIYSKEGTLAHELADVTLHSLYKGLPKKELNKEVRRIKGQVKKLFHDPKDKTPWKETQWDEMVREVQKFVDYVQETYNEAKAKSNMEPEIILEERLDYSFLVPQGFGTGDVIIIADNLIYIIDLKYGKGIRVEAKVNTQMILYALAAILLYDLVYDFDRAKMVIVQPRLNHVSEWECSTQYLHNYGDENIREKAKQAWEGKGDKFAGEHCRFCKVRAICRTNMDFQLNAATAFDLAPPESVETEQLAQVLSKSSMLVSWIQAVEEHLFNKAKAGYPVPGFKIVAGRSNRKWKDESQVTVALDGSGRDPQDFLESKLMSLTNIEKKLGTEEFQAVLGHNVVQPEGKPTLVPSSDKRPGIGLDTAREEFKDIQV